MADNNEVNMDEVLRQAANAPTTKKSTLKNEEGRMYGLDGLNIDPHDNPAPPANNINLGQDPTPAWLTQTGEPAQTAPAKPNQAGNFLKALMQNVPARTAKYEGVRAGSKNAPTTQHLLDIAAKLPVPGTVTGSSKELLQEVRKMMTLVAGETHISAGKAQFVKGIESVYAAIYADGTIAQGMLEADKRDIKRLVVEAFELNAVKGKNQSDAQEYTKRYADLVGANKEVPSLIQIGEAVSKMTPPENGIAKSEAKTAILKQARMMVVIQAIDSKLGLNLMPDAAQKISEAYAHISSGEKSTHTLRERDQKAAENFVSEALQQAKQEKAGREDLANLKARLQFSRLKGPPPSTPGNSGRQ